MTWLSKAPALSVRSILELSTGHLTEKTASEMALNLIELPSSLKQDENGYFLAVHPDPECDASYPDCIQPHLALARDNNCDFILYDRDAALTPGLPAWDW